MSKASQNPSRQIKLLRNYRCSFSTSYSKQCQCQCQCHNKNNIALSSSSSPHHHHHHPHPPHPQHHPHPHQHDFLVWCHVVSNHTTPSPKKRNSYSRHTWKCSSSELSAYKPRKLFGTECNWRGVPTSFSSPVTFFGVWPRSPMPHLFLTNAFRTTPRSRGVPTSFYSLVIYNSWLWGLLHIPPIIRGSFHHPFPPFSTSGPTWFRHASHRSHRSHPHQLIRISGHRCHTLPGSHGGHTGQGVDTSPRDPLLPQEISNE